MKNSNSKKIARKVPLSLTFIRLIYNTFGRLFPVYFSNRAYEQWFTTIRFKTPEYELPAIESADKETIAVNGLDICVYIWQKKNCEPKKSLLFIHGWTGRGSQVVNYIQKLNALGYRVIGFDGPAHGNSPGRQTSALEITDVVLALNKQYGHFDAAITHSFGGMILMYAMSLGLKVDRAVLICPPDDFQGILENFQRILMLPDSVMQALVRKSYATHGKNIRDALDTVNNVRQLKCKGLLIHDEDDSEISWHSSEKITNAWPGAQFIKTRGLGHRRIIHDEGVIKRTMKFLDDNTG